MARFVPVLVLLVAIVSCAPDPQGSGSSSFPVADDSTVVTSLPTPVPSSAAHAHADLNPNDVDGVTGTVDFIRLENGVRVLAFIQGLDDGLFGFHIFEGASCEQPGAHFNPGGSLHGDVASAPEARHAGDLGNIRSERGRARYDRIDTILVMDSTDSIMGHVVAVAAGQDDLNSQPGGGAGDITACGIIEAR